MTILRRKNNRITDLEKVLAITQVEFRYVLARLENTERELKIANDNIEILFRHDPVLHDV